MRSVPLPATEIDHIEGDSSDPEIDILFDWLTALVDVTTPTRDLRCRRLVGSLSVMGFGACHG